MKLKANLDFEWNGKTYKFREEFEEDAEIGSAMIHAGVAFEVYPTDLAVASNEGVPEPAPMKVERLPEPEAIPAPNLTDGQQEADNSEKDKTPVKKGETAKAPQKGK